MMTRFHHPAFALVDLDGTLVDPAPGIIGSCRYALETMGHEAPEPLPLRWIIGPPLRQSFAELLAGRGDPEEALRHYRSRYSTTGLFEAAVYDGVEDMLTDLRKAELRLILCTSKPTVFAVRILAHFSLDQYFDGVYGAELDGRFEDKGSLIAHLLETEGIQASDACMIGDRKHDVLAAHRNGLLAIGALWGFGGEAELRLACADAMCLAPKDMASVFDDICIRKNKGPEDRARHIGL
jgi:phosphoglycolate phosphatase